MDQKMIVFLVIAVAVGLAGGAGIGYLVFDEEEVNTDETYWYYLYFADGDNRNKWYSATGSDATVAFDKAMDKAGFEWTKSGIGYVGAIDGEDGGGYGWAIYCYLYSIYTNEAVEGSISFPAPGSYFTMSNGWASYNGFNVEGDDAEKMKMYQSGANVFILSPYNTDTINPITGYDDWKASGPFAA